MRCVFRWFTISEERERNSTVGGGVGCKRASECVLGKKKVTTEKLLVIKFNYVINRGTCRESTTCTSSKELFRNGDFPEFN